MDIDLDLNSGLKFDSDSFMILILVLDNDWLEPRILLELGRIFGNGLGVEFINLGSQAFVLNFYVDKGINLDIDIDVDLELT